MVVPTPIWFEILRLAHAGSMAGDLGVNKTYDLSFTKFLLARSESRHWRNVVSCVRFASTGKPTK